MSAGAAARAEAARVLVAVLDRGRSLRAALARALPRLADARDRALVEAIVFEVLRRRLTYQALRAALLERALPGRVREVAALLLAGLAQLEGLGMPEYAVVDATAEAARQLRQPHLVGLVNAVLRRFVREHDRLCAAAAAGVAGQCEHPDWLRRIIEQDWGGQAGAVLAANNVPAPQWLRVNLRRQTAGQCIQALAQAGVPARPSPHCESAIALYRRSAPGALPGFADGGFSVQDLAAQFMPRLLACAPGDRVLDACAAPGGKTAHLLEHEPAPAEVLALDIDPVRLRRVAETLARLQLRATLREADAGTPGQWWDGVPLQRIVLDAPCSGTGVIRRQPDIKWHRRESDLPVLEAAQARLLEALWPLLAPGGRLVYATCSVLKAENERQIDAFLLRHRDALALAFELPLGRRSGAGWQILPGEGEADGFFYAVLERRTGRGRTGGVHAGHHA
ncbi:MAG TPA: 16S rRNA (cytosine(967)-C(5))-methyltransferase RsmB [Xanthomonadaceae bacterium]|nr:16S rRNA (cytosine(967)-C(5))-methyltransferase RsmB [Xanthomonadaceae bacterium]